MEIIKNKKMRVNSLIVVLSGLILVAASLLVFLLIVQAVYGNYRLDEIVPTKQNISAFFQEKNIKVALVNPNDSKVLFEKKNTWIEDNLYSWKKYLNDFDVDYSIITASSIDYEILSEFDLLVLPNTRVLSEISIQRLKNYLEHGGSIIATGATASYDKKANWRGWSFLETVFGVKFIKELDGADKFKQHTLTSGNAITSNIPNGYSLRVATWDNPINVKVMDPRTKQLSFWYDFRTEDGLVDEEINNSTGIAYGNYKSGRFIWFGFEINSVIENQEGYIYFEKLLLNSLSWLTKSPTINLRNLPDGYDAAMISTIELNNLQELYLVSDEIQKSKTSLIIPITQLDLLSNYKNELNQYENIIFNVNNLFQSKLDTQEKYDYLDEFLSKTVKILPGWIENFNGDLFVNKNNFNYGMIYHLNNAQLVLSDTMPNRSFPIFDSKKIVITNNNKSYSEIYNAIDSSKKGLIEYTLLEDLNRVKLEGGVYIKQLSSSIDFDVQILNKLDSVAKDNGYWIASLGEIRNWLMNIGSINVNCISKSNKRILVEISNYKNTSAHNFIVEVFINKNIDGVELSSDIINTDFPSYKYDSVAQKITLFIDYIEPEATRSFFIDFNNIS